MKYNFIRTTDAETKDELVTLGFKLVSQDGNVFTFINDHNLSFEYKDKDKIQYTNILSI